MQKLKRAENAQLKRLLYTPMAYQLAQQLLLVEAASGKAFAAWQKRCISVAATVVLHLQVEGAPMETCPQSIQASQKYVHYTNVWAQPVHKVHVSHADMPRKHA